MTAPTPYNRVFNFTNYQTANPASPLPGNEVDAEYNAIVVAMASTQASLALIQRSDGQLANASVGYQQLQPYLLTGMNPPTLWSSAGISYVAGQTVFYGLQFYVCNMANTSSATSPPSSNSAWTFLADFSGVVLAPGSVTATALANGAVTSAALASGLALPSSPATGDDSTAVATTAYVQNQIAATFADLPTSLPATEGVVWDNGGAISTTPSASTYPSPTFNTVTAKGWPHAFYGTDWLTPLINWPVNTSALVVLSPNGQAAVTGAAQTGNISVSNPVAIGLAGYGYNTGATTKSAAWGGYFEGRQYTGATSNAYGVEIEIANVTASDAAPATPYSLYAGMTIAASIESGADVAGDTPSLTAKAATVGAFFADNGAAFKSGIIFKATAIAGTNGNDGNTGEAVALATGHIIRWYQPGGGGGGYIYSAQTSGDPVGIIFENGTLDFVGSAAGANCLQINGSAPTSGNTTLSLLVCNDAGVNVVPVTMGPANGAGTGFRVLCIPN